MAAGGDPDSAVGLAQILPGTATGLLGMRVDLARHRGSPARLARERRIALGLAQAAQAPRARGAASRRCWRAAAADRRALRPGQVDRRRRALPGVRREEARAARPGRRVVPHGHRQPAGRDRRLRAPAAADRIDAEDRREVRHHLRAPLLRLDAGPQRGGVPQARTGWATTRATTCSSSTRPTRSCACTRRGQRRCSTGSRRSRRPRRAARTCCARPTASRLRGRARPAPRLRQGRADRAARRAAPAGLQDRPRHGLARAAGSRSARALFRGLRPEALATLLYITKEVRRDAGGSHLRVTSTVRDLKYQRALVGVNSQATRTFSLHTTGYAVDVARDFRNARRGARVHRRARAAARPQRASTSSTSRARSTSRSGPRPSGCCRCSTA